MHNTANLLEPFFRQTRNRFKTAGLKGRFRYVAFGLFGLAVGIGIAVASFWIFSRLQNLGVIGPIITLKLFSLILFFLFFFLTMSHVLNAISTFYLAEDLTLLHSLPIDLPALFQARFLDCFWRSSWMTAALASVSLWAFGYVVSAPWFFYLAVPFLLILFSLIPAALGTGFTFGLLSIFPARKLRDLLLLLTVITVGALYLFFRVLQPESWFQEERFHDVIGWVSRWSLPHESLLPSHWITELLGLLALGSSRYTSVDLWFYAGLLTTTAWVFYFLSELLFKSLYLDGWLKTQENPLAHRLLRSAANFWLAPAGLRSSAISLPRLLMLKELKLMLRDSQRFVQLVLIAALVAVYAYNFKVINVNLHALGSPQIRLLFVLLNLGFSALVLAALTVRFAYPSVSLEGRAFWVLRAAPISMRVYLWSKFTFFYALAAFLAVFILGLTNFILNVNWQVHLLAQMILIPFVAVLVALATGMGAWSPQLKAEHHSQITTGFGAMAYMALALFLIILFFLCVARAGWTWLNIEEGKIASSGEWVLTTAAVLGAVMILTLGVLIPMRLGIRSLQQFEE